MSSACSCVLRVKRLLRVYDYVIYYEGLTGTVSDIVQRSNADGVLQSPPFCTSKEIALFNLPDSFCVFT